MTEKNRAFLRAINWGTVTLCLGGMFTALTMYFSDRDETRKLIHESEIRLVGEIHDTQTIVSEIPLAITDIKRELEKRNDRFAEIEKRLEKLESGD